MSRPAENLGARNLAAVWRIGARAALILAFLVAGGAWSLQISGLDPRAPVGAGTASLRSQLVIGVALAILLLFGAPAWRRLVVLVRENLWLMAVVALALVSTVWAPEPAVAARRALAFSATVLGGLAVAARLPGREAMAFIAQATAAAVLLSIAYTLIEPGYGVHQVTDGVQSIHAGDWRGLFVHRTALGQIAPLSLAFAVHGERRSFGRAAVRLLVVAASMVCLWKAHSGGGWVSAAVLLTTPATVTACRWLSRRNWLLALGMAIGAGVLLVWAAPMAMEATLRLLGKDATLTGRTDLWRLMLRAAAERPLFGYGYSTGFRDSVARLVDVRGGFGYVPNAQNGYLDVVLNLGLVGLALVLAGLAQALWRAARLAWRPPGEGGEVLPLLVVVFIVELNAVEAALISANDIFVLIYVVAFGALARLSAVAAPACDRSPRR